MKARWKRANAAGVVQPVALGRDLEGEDVPRLVARLHVPHRLIAAEQQGRAGEEHERERRLRHDQTVAGPAPARGGPAAAVAQPIEARLGRAQRGQPAAEERDQRRGDAGEEQRAPAHGDVADAGHAGRHEPEVQRHADPGQHHGERPREQGDDGGLGDLRPEELQPGGADGAAHGQLALPPLRADQEEVAHVGAGDEQHDGHRPEQDPDRGGHLAHEMLLQGTHHGPVPGHQLGVAGRPAEPLGQAPRQRRQLALQVGNGGAGTQPPDHAHAEAARHDVGRPHDRR